MRNNPSWPGLIIMPCKELLALYLICGYWSFCFCYLSIGKKALFVATVEIRMMLTVCSSMLINDFTGLYEHNVYDICFIGLMDHTLWNSTSPTPPPPPPTPDIWHFELSLGLRMVFKCRPYCHTRWSNAPIACTLWHLQNRTIQKKNVTLKHQLWGSISMHANFSLY